MVVAVGDTGLVTAVPPHEPEYHLYVPVGLLPAVPPVADKVTEVPEQTEVELALAVGAVLPGAVQHAPVTVTVTEPQDELPQLFS